VRQVRRVDVEERCPQSVGLGHGPHGVAGPQDAAFPALRHRVASFPAMQRLPDGPVDISLVVPCPDGIEVSHRHGRK
jgi:hypothetical protein